MLKALSKIFLVFSILFGFVLAGPVLLINRYTLEWASTLIPDTSLTWESVDVDVDYQSLLSRHFRVKLRQLNLRYQDYAAEVNSAYIVLKTDISKPFGVALLKFDADISSVSLSQTEKKSNSSDLEFKIPKFVAKIVESLVSCEWNIRTDHLVIGDKKGRFLLSGHSEHQPELTIELNLDEQADLTATLALYDATAKRGTLKFFARKQEMSGGLDFKFSESALHSDIRLTQGRVAAHGVLDMQFTKESETHQGQGLLKIDLLTPDLPVSKTEAQVRISTRLDSRQLEFDLDSDILSKITLLTNSKEIVDLTPKGLSFKGLTTVIVSSQGGDIGGSVSSYIAVQEKDTKGVSLRGELDYKLIFGEKFDQKAKVDLMASLKDVKKIESALRGTDLEIPAPFNQLDGQLSCQLLNDPLDIRTDLSELNLSCESVLASEEQRYKIKARLFLLNVLKVKEQPHINGDISIQDAKLQLPHMSLKDPLPKLESDPRIVMSSSSSEFPAKTKKVPFTYHLRIKNEGKPVLVNTEFFEDPIPIDLEFSLNSQQGVKGAVKVNNHPLTLFRREALVRQIQILLKPDHEDPDIEGDILFDNNNYQISMKIYGSVREPKYTFESRPYLNHDDIMSMLLFGKKNSELAQVDMKSAKSARHAVADKAINLLSMYYLASTPVESIDYNPEDGVLSARLNLTKGTSLNLGKNSKDKKVAKIQQVLGENWIFETSYSQDGQKKKSANGVIKWIQRY